MHGEHPFNGPTSPELETQDQMSRISQVMKDREVACWYCLQKCSSAYVVKDGEASMLAAHGKCLILRLRSFSTSCVGKHATVVQQILHHCFAIARDHTPDHGLVSIPSSALNSDTCTFLIHFSWCFMGCYIYAARFHLQNVMWMLT